MFIWGMAQQIVHFCGYGNLFVACKSIGAGRSSKLVSKMFSLTDSGTSEGELTENYWVLNCSCHQVLFWPLDRRFYMMCCITHTVVWTLTSCSLETVTFGKQILLTWLAASWRRFTAYWVSKWISSNRDPLFHDCCWIVQLSTVSLLSENLLTLQTRHVAANKIYSAVNWTVFRIYFGRRSGNGDSGKTSFAPVASGSWKLVE